MKFDHISTATTQFLSQESVSKNPTSLPKYFQDRVVSKTNHGGEADTVVMISDSAFKKFARSQYRAPKISFELDSESNDIVVNMVDPESGEVIRQIPDEKTQVLSERIHEFQKLFLKVR